MGWRGRTLAAASAAVASRWTYRRLTTPPDGETAHQLRRVNHRGDAVSLAQGPATAVGSLVGLMCTPGIPRSVRGASLLAVGTSGALGTYDDLAGATTTKGLRGHVGALGRGEVTSGSVKLLGIGATGLVAGAVARRGKGGVPDALLAGCVVAGSANLLNLLDLRPGRALKVFLAASVPVAVSKGGTALAAPMSAAASLMAEDLSEQSMLGDAGANALGAAWGVAACSRMSRRSLAATAAVIVGLTLASERVSFSAVIDRNPLLHRLDSLGRRHTS